MSDTADRRSPILLAHPDAIPTLEGDPSPGVAWHYGDPLGEQRAADRGAVVIDRSDRAVIEVSGAERLSWLHTICTQHLTELADRRSAEALSLDGNGRIEDHFVLTDVDAITWVDTEHDRGAALTDFLTKMIFWAKVDVAARPDLAVLTLIGPQVRSGPIAERLDIPADAPVYAAGDLPEMHHDEEPLGFWRIMPPTGEGRSLPVVDLMVPESELRQWWTELADAGAVPAGMWTFDALRVAAARPRLGLDVDERTIPHEADWIGGPDESGAGSDASGPTAYGAVHLDKGCYRGQETVARVANLGRPPRRLVLLHLDGSAASRPSTGDPVTAGGRTVGRVGTVIDHHELGPIALALVKRSVPADAELAAGPADDPAAAVAARIDPQYYTADDQTPPGRAAQQRLRS